MSAVKLTVEIKFNVFHLCSREALLERGTHEEFWPKREDDRGQHYNSLSSMELFALLHETPSRWKYPSLLFFSLISTKIIKWVVTMQVKPLTKACTKISNKS